MWFCCFVVLFVGCFFLLVSCVCGREKKSYSGDVWLVWRIALREHTDMHLFFSQTEKRIILFFRQSKSLLWSCGARPPPLRRFLIIYI